MINRLSAKAFLINPLIVSASIFVGEEEDLPDKKFGVLLPNRRYCPQIRKLCRLCFSLEPQTIKTRKHSKNGLVTDQRS